MRGLLALLAALLGGCAGVPDRTYVNPVLDRDFPDPAVLRAPGGWFFVYATQGAAGERMLNIQVARSPDLVQWEHLAERTREIGLRMAVGARTRDILGQFLVEAVTLSLIGGLVGVALGMGAAMAIASFARWRVLLSPEAVGLAVAFAFVIGVFFGFYPARKAARLNPVEALRFE